MDINLTNRMYKIDSAVCVGTRHVNVKEQRGRLFVNYKGRQVNIKDIPVLPQEENDCVYNYIFNQGFINYPCKAMEYWIYRHRLGHKISVQDYKIKFAVKKL